MTETAKLIADQNAAAVIDKIKSRADIGLAKYGVTTDRTDLSELDWLQHLQEELLDAAIYVERLIAILKAKEAEND